MIAIKNFQRKTFLNLIFFSLILNLTWGLIATQLEIIHGRDKGFISGLGYLIVYGLTFFLCIEKARQTFNTFLALTLSFIGTFLISSFVIVPIFINFDTLLYHDIIGVFASDLFSTVLIVIIVSKYFPIKFKFLTGVITFIVAVVTTLVLSTVKNIDYYDQIFQPMSIFYSVWQLVTTTTLALGIAMK